MAFHAGLDRALEQRERLTAALKPFGVDGALLLMAACAAAVALAVWLTGRFAPQAAGSGIQHVKGVEQGRLPLWPLSVVWVKFIGGILGIGGGLVLGREGPTVQMGASVADHLGLRLGLDGASRRTLLVVGAGAGLAGAFNAPLAGTLFAVEELGAPFRPVVYLGTLLAAAVTDLCVRFWLGQPAELSISAALAPPLSTLGPALLVGAAAGALGAFFNGSLLRALALADRFRRCAPGWTLGAVLGAALGAVAWFVTDLPGGGVLFAKHVLDGNPPLRQVLWLLPLCFTLTVTSYAVGAPGGIFAPLLVLGALLGSALHAAWLALLPAWPASMPLLAAAGMAGLFAAVVRSPLTGAVLMVEMTGSYTLVLSVVAASLAAHAVAAALGSEPIYDSLLARAAAA